MTRDAIVVTGLGVVSALGSDLDSFASALEHGECGARESPKLAELKLRRSTAATVPREPIYQCLEPSSRALPWASAMGLYALRAARKNAQLCAAMGPSEGLFVGCSTGAPDALERAGRPLAEADPTDPVSLANYAQGSVVAKLAHAAGAQGIVQCLTTTCAAGNYALAGAWQALHDGTVQVACAGGVEELGAMPYTAFHQLRALGNTCRPFDRTRDGILFGEGAAFLVLEREVDARRRGAPVLAYLLGLGFSNDAYHLVTPDPEGKGATLALQRALAEAGVMPTEVGYVNAHGTGTPLNDSAEAKAIVAVFGAHAKSLPVSSTKGATGHAMAAASAVEAVITVMALGRAKLPPTAGLVEPDQSIGLDLIRQTARVSSAQVAVSNAFGFGGNNGVAVLARHAVAKPRPARRAVYLQRLAMLLGNTLGAEAVWLRLVRQVPALAGGERSTLDPATVLGTKGLRHVDRSALLLAMTLDHELKGWPEVASERAGAVIGAAYPAYNSVMAILREAQQHGPAQVNPMLVPFASANCAPSWWLLRRGITGYNASTGSLACAGLDAMLLAAQEIANGRVDALVAGGVEAYNEALWRGYLRLWPQTQPLVEAVAVIAFSAEAQGAFGRVVASAQQFDGTQPEQAGMRAWAQVLQQTSGTVPELLLTVGTSGEGLAARVISVDAHYGHALGASSALAAAVAAQHLVKGVARSVGVLAVSSEGYASAAQFAAL